MSFGQCTYLDNAQDGRVSDFTSAHQVVIAISAPLTGVLIVLDGDGAPVASFTAGQSGVTVIAGPVYRMEYHLSSPADIGLVTVAFTPT